MFGDRSDASNMRAKFLPVVRTTHAGVVNLQAGKEDPDRRREDRLWGLIALQPTVRTVDNACEAHDILG